MEYFSIATFVMRGRFPGYILVTSIFKEGKGRTVVSKHAMRSAFDPIPKYDCGEYADLDSFLKGHDKWVDKMRNGTIDWGDGEVTE